MRTRAISAVDIPAKSRVRFWSHVRVTEGCWEWTGAKYRRGYGNFHIRGFGNIHAHIVAFLLFHKDVTLQPSDCICHHCDNPPCCRPSHLFKGTKKDNTADMIQKGRARFIGFQFVKNYRKGEQMHNAKLSDRDVREIKAARLRGVGQKVLAKKYGIRYQTIQAIDHGRTWKHVQLQEIQPERG